MTRPSGRYLALLAGLTAIVFGGTIVALSTRDDGGEGDAPSTTNQPLMAATDPLQSVAPDTSLFALPSTPSTVVEPTIPTSSAPVRPEQGVAMTLTLDINPDAVWDDGSPITAADFRCTWRAHAETPGALRPAGYDKITSVRAGNDRKEVVVTFSEPYAAYRDLFDGLMKADAVDDCADVSTDFQDDVPFSAGPHALDTWSPERSVLVANPRYWGDPAEVQRVVIVALPDPVAEFEALRRAEVDLIAPQFIGPLEDQFADPNVEVVRSYSGDYEALYFQHLNGPFADPVFREAFWKSIDPDAFYDAIYAPLAAGRPRLTCGPIVSREYCPDDAFGDTFDPDGAAEALAAAGWVKDAEGFWAKDGVIPEVRWMVNSGNARREASQAHLIPLLAQAGFRVVADNCVAECVFEQRLPALDYDLAMYASTAPPDPGFLTVAFSCANVPSAENDFRGQNQQGWCNPEASALLERADVTMDEDDRADLVQEAILLMAADHVLLPLFEIPQITAVRTDRIDGALGEDNEGFRAFEDYHAWGDEDGNGEIVIGAEQFPLCLNPVTECAASPWFRRAVVAPLLPSVWEIASDGSYGPTDLVTDEPELVVTEET